MDLSLSTAKIVEGTTVKLATRLKSSGMLLRTKVIFFLYRWAVRAAFPFLLLYVLLRIVRDRRYQARIGERFGFWRLKQRTAPGAIWFHAVSVGEVLSLIDLVKQLRDTVSHTPVFVTSSTLAGREIAESKLGEFVDGVFYAPIDMPFAVRRVLRLIRPSVLVVLETELWPNLYREAKRAGSAVVIVNGRISDKAAPKYSRFRWFFSVVFAYVDDILAQSEQDEKRFIAAGATPDQVRIAGNLKYDFEPASGNAPEAVLRTLRHPLWIAASTTGPMYAGDVDEDDVVLAAHSELTKRWPELQLLIAPRKPERFDVVAEKLGRGQVDFVRRSELGGQERSPSVVLLDSIGELGSLFPHSDLVFMGGTLADRGGHNLLEPTLCGKPVVAGPHLENFAAIRDRFAAARGYIPISDASQLSAAVESLLEDDGQRSSLGARARALAETERGATRRALRLIVAKRWQFIPRAMPWRPLMPILWILSKIWAAGSVLKRALTKTESLAAPVISIGGIAMGGVGKTPMTRYLAETLRFSGHNPAILTRGYKRQSKETLCLAAGENVPSSLTGDEAQLLLRSADVGVGSDRWKVGLKMQDVFHPGIFLLDDGFQHCRLRRDVDIVLLDGIDPFAGNALFPIGRLRESVESLKRADIIVITRAGARKFDGVLQRLPDVPVFYAEIEIVAWRPQRPVFDDVAAFCGLANPLTFFESLKGAGARVVVQETFPDHHRYTSDELRRFVRKAQAAGARALVTTEKDFVNLPQNASELVAPLSLYYLEARIRVRDESVFLREIERLVESTATRPGERAKSK